MDRIENTQDNNEIRCIVAIALTFLHRLGMQECENINLVKGDVFFRIERRKIKNTHIENIEIIE